MMEYDHDVSWLLSEPTISFLHRFTEPVIIYGFTSPRCNKDHTRSENLFDLMDCV